MNFRIRRHDEPEINLIPFIDVLLVILIFLLLSTTFSRFTELQVNLPSADAEQARARPREVLVSVGADGRYAIDRQVLPARSPEALAAALQASSGGPSDGVVVVIHADAAAPHQAVMQVLEAARAGGLAHVTFAAQSRQRKAP